MFKAVLELKELPSKNICTNGYRCSNVYIQIIEKGAIGLIATHDLEICNTTADYPDTVINKCFEVAVVNDELIFDCKIRDGICKNKNATFLMQKMDII